MPYSARILADSLAPSGSRLTTWELTYPRMVHSELMTHREFSRNSASSRAIPIEKMIQRVVDDPVLPVYWGKNQKGMQAGGELDEKERGLAEWYWLDARDEAVRQARTLLAMGVHKQIVNRLLEPWMWITVICSATNFSNFFHLRCHPDAQPEIRRLAEMMRAVYFAAEPRALAHGDWHLPLVNEEAELNGMFGDPRKISVGRCARVSYLTHDGKRDPKADIALADRLLKSGHWSPFEHVAMATDHRGVRSGNFTGWLQYRKRFEGEYVDHYEATVQA